MDLNAIVQSIDAEIVRLEKVRELLSDQTTPTRKRRKVSAAARARMAAAQRARRAKEKRK
jgi:hypothetical protein